MEFTQEQMERAKYLLYRELVQKETEKNVKREYLEFSDLRSAYFHIDHRASIKECYNNEVPVEIAGHICNLEVLKKSENLCKGSKSSITIQELYEQCMQRDSDLAETAECES